MNTHLFIIHLESRKDRYDHLMEQLKGQNITDYTIVPGIKDPMFVQAGIGDAHKLAVRMAMAKGYDNCIIGEDDLGFTDKGAWDYFLSQIPESYDLMLSMIYEGKINKDNRIVPDAFSFHGLTLYSVHSRFYFPFLNMNRQNHLDSELGRFCDKYEYYVSENFCTKQIDGYSDNKKQDCKYDHLLKGRKLYTNEKEK